MIVTSQVSVEPNSTTLLFDVNPSRRRAYIKVPTGNSMYIGGSATVDDTDGYHIDAGEEFVIEPSTASDCSARYAMYAYHENGTAQVVCVMEVIE
jgi:hypothetical protein